MDQPILAPDPDEDAAELALPAAAVAEARADPRSIPHAEVRAWLLRLAAGDFKAKVPTPKL